MGRRNAMSGFGSLKKIAAYAFLGVNLSSLVSTAVAYPELLLSAPARADNLSNVEKFVKIPALFPATSWLVQAYDGGHPMKYARDYTPNDLIARASFNVARALTGDDSDAVAFVAVAGALASEVGAPGSVVGGAIGVAAYKVLKP